MSIIEEAKIWEKIMKAKQEGSEIILYGAELIGHLLHETLKVRGVDICSFCTSYEPEHIDRETGLKVLNRESLRFHQEALVIVGLGITYSNRVYEEIRSYCLAVGIKEKNLILRTGDWFLKLGKPYIDGKGKLHVYTLSYHVTKLCNLKCRMCGQLLFGSVKRRSFPSEQIIRDTDKIFRIIDNISVMKLIGGEVMMYRELDKLILHLNQYREQIGMLELYTNGAVIPKTSLLEAIKAYQGHFQITMSDYGELSVAKDTWLDFGSQADIRVNILNFTHSGHTGSKGWINCTETVNLQESREELLEKYVKCGQRLDFVLEDSVIGKCTSFHMLNYATGQKLSPEEGIYLHDGLSDEEIREKILAFGSDETPLEICKYCIWGSKLRDTLPRYPAAEQMEKFPD